MAALPVHTEIPDGLATKTTLKKQGLVPRGDPVAIWRWYKHRGGDTGWQATPLYRASAASPRSAQEREQARADRRAQDAARVTRRAEIREHYDHELTRLREEALAESQASFEKAVARFRTWATSPDRVIIDTETTGLHGVVIDLAVTRVDGTVLFDSPIRPTEPIEAGARRVHGLSDADVRDAPTWLDILPDLAPVLAGHRVIAFNAPFDMACIRRTAEAAGGRGKAIADGQYWGCAMRNYAPLTWDWDGEREQWRWPSLAYACTHAGVAREPGVHRARGGALALARLITQVAEHPPAVPDTVPPGREPCWEDVGWTPETHPGW
ncbi:exonuclease domain-containing protein [Deinococcus rufus]|uniref:Exonuclease domain-containing protein n=1 Tax=Deinococcus rufus TaxID=2136097 RepID=A0ABV7ZAZ1_9DEIO